jgi:polar amino acid transport system substrate-binding protein
VLGRRHVLTRFLLAATLLALAGACERIPQDPRGTLDRVTGATMRVGVSEMPPWTQFDDGEIRGVEVELVRRFADELGAEIAWVQGSEAALLEALERYELDLVIAGLTDDTPWNSRLGLTTPYVTTKTLVGVPPASPPPAELAGLEVAVERGDVAAALLREKGAVPVVVADLSAASGPVAADDWWITAQGLRTLSTELQEEKHVMAVPPGENAWLVRLERFLSPLEDLEVRRLLRATAEAEP